MSLLEQLGRELDPNAINQMSRQLGVDSATTSRAVAAALPMLVGALARNASRPEGAQALDRAIARDHDGGVLDDVAGFLGGGGAGGGIGEAILGHVLGGKRTRAEQSLGGIPGLDSRKAGQMLAMLAPLVLGMLGRQKRQSNLDQGGLADALGRERDTLRRSQPEATSMLDSFLDADGDGQIIDDLAGIGTKMMGSFFSRR